MDDYQMPDEAPARREAPRALDQHADHGSGANPAGIGDGDYECRLHRESTLRAKSGWLAVVDQRLIAAVAMSSAAHAILAVLIGGTTSPAELTAPHAPSTPIQLRLALAESILAEREVTEPLDQMATPEIVLASEAGSEADGVAMPVTAASSLPHDISQSHATALAAPLHQVEINDRHISASAPVEATVTLQEELEVQPVPIDPVIPNYPSEEGAASAGGLIKLQLLIDEVGRVTSVDVLESALPEAFGVSATRAFEAVRFRPGLRDGLPVRCRITTSIQFAPTALAQMTTAQPDAQVGQRE